jgi:hypothetical protein
MKSRFTVSRVKMEKESIEEKTMGDRKKER